MKLRLIIILIATLILNIKSRAQNDNTLYFLPGVAQSTYMNPTNIGSHRTMLGLPFISSNYLYLGNSGFRYRDFVQRSGDSLSLNMQRGIDKMARRNIFMTSYNTDLLFIGVRKGKTYITLNVTEKVNTNFIYPKGFFELAWYGNGEYLGERLSFDGLALNLDHYREFALGFARKFGKNLTIGFRGKVLQGMSNIQTKRSELGLTTDETTFDLKVDGAMEIRTAGLYPIYEEGQNFFFKDYFFHFDNLGFAADLSATYELNKKWSFNASLLDFGMINWKNGIRNFSQDNFEIEFKGVNATDFFKVYNNNNNIDFAQDGLSKVVDSLQSIFNLEQNEVHYRTWLSSRLILGAQYKISDWQSFGVMFDGRFIRNIFRPSLAMSYNIRLGQTLSTSVNYSIYNREFLNVGFGLCFNLGVFQLYGMADNVLAPILPTHMRNIHARFGLNFVFDKVREKKEKVPKDLPKFE